MIDGTDRFIDDLQLRRLANAVLSKSPADLAALAENNPELIAEWQAEFRRRRLAAEVEARSWAAAMAALSTSSPQRETHATVARLRPDRRLAKYPFSPASFESETEPALKRG